MVEERTLRATRISTPPALTATIVATETAHLTVPVLVGVTGGDARGCAHPNGGVTLGEEARAQPISLA